ncbi:MAG: CBS domain-containing protein [candidate division Zixibacteria bacterium]|nr:CBS domain-containing protein [candidate division Zixibacteria bacterium]NIR64119.1 CBS domain-containing protein [candidate division Zixibacteria bacterium]NIS16915.1 CBS domain-containing protein [candidate division Zixibacteria bacterium]NIS46019.1 CBS domain-containing protein [candidate division Zixibacteria bacterium]NIT52009.1 CBS domain-containing protein [candidate division Zixibacteria bacterium]
MKTKEIMREDIKLIHPERTLTEAAKKMQQFDIGALPVVDEDKVVGMITDRDILVRAVAEGANPDQTKTGDVMTKEVVTVYDDQDVEEAKKLMKENQIRRLVILNRDNQVSGVISLGDLATAAFDREDSGEVLEKVSEAEHKK